MIELPDGVRLVLASASPRRSELLGSVGLEFEVIPADIDESVLPGETPSGYVARLSAEKAASVAQRVGSDVIVVAADTTVDVDGLILEKPVDADDARRMLGLLSGRTHLVHTGVTVLPSGRSVAVGSAATGSGSTIVVETASSSWSSRRRWWSGTSRPGNRSARPAVMRSRVRVERWYGASTAASPT